MSTEDLDLVNEIIKALNDAEAAWLSDLRLEAQGKHAAHVFYAGTAHMSNVLVLTEHIIKDVRTLAVTRMADRLVVTGYTDVQRDALKQVTRLDAEAERVRADLVLALTGDEHHKPWKAADAVPYYADTLVRLEAERELWADLEKHGDVPTSVGLALSWVALDGSASAPLDAAVVVHRRNGARAFVRSNTLKLNDTVPLGLVNALFSL